MEGASSVEVAVTNGSMIQNPSGLVLNWDVLLVLTPFLTPTSWWYRGRPDVLSLMMTYRTLYYAGTPVLLSGPIHISSNSVKIRSFCKFILKEDRRAHYLRELHLAAIDDPRYTPESMSHLFDVLIRVLERACNVDTLHIADAKSLLECDSRFAGAITSLTKVKTLHVGDVGDKAQKMIMAMNSPVASAAVSFMSPIDLENDALLPDPAPLLQHFSGTLTDLSFRGIDIDFQPSGRRFPHVRSLKVETYGASFFDENIKELMDTFPNVTYLRWWVIMEDIDVEVVEQLRAGNQSHTSKSWPHLDVLSSGIEACYALALTSRVRVWSSIELDRRNQRYFHTIMGEIQPSMLSLAVSAKGFKVEELPNLLPTASVTHLDITLRFNGCKASVAEFLDAFIITLQKFPLIYLVLRFAYRGKKIVKFRARSPSLVPPTVGTIHNAPDEGADEPDGFELDGSFNIVRDPSPDHIRDYLEVMDVYEYTWKLANSVTTLTHVFIELSQKEPRYSFSRVVRNEGMLVELVTLTEKEGWNVIWENPFH